MKKCTILLILILTGIRHAFGQGFVNLDFEGANLSGYNPGDSVPASDAIPGWTAYLSGAVLTNIDYNNYNNFSGDVVEIVGSSVVQGNYYVLVRKAYSIGQTGTIPATAQSMIWWGAGGDTVSFNGQTMHQNFLGSEAYNVFIYGVDISSFAGQTGQLLFTSITPPQLGASLIDNIQFSSSPIPEPCVLSLLGLGGLAFLWNRRKTKVV